MISTCPNCLNRVKHGDEASEVTCECGTRFSTFYDPPKEDLTPSDPIYTESTNAFTEIREFGEGLGNPRVQVPPDPPSDPSIHMDPIPENTPDPTTDGEMTGSGSLESLMPMACLMTAAAELPGYSIDEFLSPISLWAALGNEDPLEPAFRAISQVAQEKGANAIVGLHWNLIENRILMAGTPVKITKQ